MPSCVIVDDRLLWYAPRIVTQSYLGHSSGKTEKGQGSRKEMSPMNDSQSLRNQ